jgi:hypothetical protein
MFTVLWHVDPLIGNDSEIISQQPVNSNKGMVFSAWYTPMATDATIGYSNSETVLFVRSALRYKQDN